jgi:glycosidase
MEYIVYTTATGRILYTGNCEGTLDDIDVTASQSKMLLANANSYMFTHYISGGTPVAYSGTELTNKNNPDLPEGKAWSDSTRTIVDSRTLSQARDQKWEEMKRVRATKYAENFTLTHANVTLGTRTYQANIAEINLRSSDAVMAVLKKDSITTNLPNGVPSPTWSINWLDSGNAVVTLDALAMLEITNALSERNQTVFETSQSKRTAIYVTETTVAGVDAITWT